MAIEQDGRDLRTASRAFEPPRPHCSCGGTYRLDTQYLVDAERYGVSRHVPVMWRCQMCGRSLTRAAHAPAGASPPGTLPSPDDPIVEADVPQATGPQTKIARRAAARPAAPQGRPAQRTRARRPRATATRV